MTSGYFVTGTDTDVGKTIVCARLCKHLGANYWKPLQCGAPYDAETVQTLGVAPEHILPSRHVLSEPLSPHEAAKRESVEIHLNDFSLPESEKPLIVEGAGGALVPLNTQDLMTDLMSRLGLPVLVVTRTTLGTINHTLLTLEALRAHDLTIAGLILNGPDMPHNKEALEYFGRVNVVGTLSPDHGPWQFDLPT